MKSRTFWFYNIDHAQMVWMAYMADGWTKKERLKVKFNWKKMQWMYRFKLYQTQEIKNEQD